MPITVLKANNTTVYGKLAEVLGVKVNQYGYEYLPEGTVFEGRVSGVGYETVQVMSDVREDRKYAMVVLDDLKSYKIGVDGCEVVADLTADLKALYEERCVERAVVNANLRNAEQVLKQVTPKVERGKQALVFKGRKIKPGTEVSVFWYGSCYNKFAHCNETRAGVTLADGTKVFVSAENLEPLPSQEQMLAYAEAQKALAEAQKAVEGVDAKVAA